ncbi:MAG: hypothetical protein JKX91_15415 [Rhizobiaceae bacterium]|nr:hypothetical protein [Rhizobiaceae bacterium]
MMIGSGGGLVAKADEVSNIVAERFVGYYNQLRKKAKGDKRKLSSLLKIRKSTLKKINSTPGMASRAFAVTGVKKMQAVVKK